MSPITVGEKVAVKEGGSYFTVRFHMDFGPIPSPLEHWTR